MFVFICVFFLTFYYVLSQLRSISSSVNGYIYVNSLLFYKSSNLLLMYYTTHMIMSVLNLMNDT